MTRWRIGLAILVLSLSPLVLAGEASAQGGRSRPPGRDSYSGRIQRPAVSPYMNLFRPNFGGATSYQTLVRPQLSQQATNYNQSRSLNALRRGVTSEINRVEQQQFAPTGHVTRFDYYSHFYNKGSNARRR